MFGTYRPQYRPLSTIRYLDNPLPTCYTLFISLHTTAPEFQGTRPSFPSSQTFEYLHPPPVLQMARVGDAAKEYVAGSVAGIAQVIVGHPFDTVKVYISLSSLRSCLLMLRSSQIFSGLLVDPVSAMLCPNDTRYSMKCL